MEDYIKSIDGIRSVDCIRSIKTEVKNKCIEESPISSNYRMLFSKFIDSHPKIKIENVVDGDIRFSVSMSDLDLTYQEIKDYRTQLYSYLAVNFMGELLVRENIDEFALILTSIDKDKYAFIVNGFEHKKFGLRIIKGRFHFSFHISLVQSILNEDFKRELRLKMEES